MTTIVSFSQNQPVILGSQIGGMLPNTAEKKIYILKQGLISFRYNNSEVGKCYPRGYFYEKWIFFDDESILDQIDPIRHYDIYSIDKSPSICYVISKTALEESLGMSYREIILMSFFKSSLSKSQFFSNFFTESQSENLFHIFELIFYQKGELVYGTDSSKK